MPGIRYRPNSQKITIGRTLLVGLEIELLGLVADSEHKMLRSLSATKPNSLISRPSGRSLPVLKGSPLSPRLTNARDDDDHIQIVQKS